MDILEYKSQILNHIKEVELKLADALMSSAYSAKEPLEKELELLWSEYKKLYKTETDDTL